MLWGWLGANSFSSLRKIRENNPARGQKFKSSPPRFSQRTSLAQFLLTGPLSRVRNQCEAWIRDCQRVNAASTLAAASSCMCGSTCE
jgi:hypothetical protein